MFIKLTLLISLFSINLLRASSDNIYNIDSNELTALNSQYYCSETDSSEAKPLLIYLHGNGKRGNDITKLEGHFNMITPRAANYNFITAIPQASNQGFNTDDLDIFLDHLMNTHNIDSSRICVIGYSGGAYATWQWTISRPGTFAAIAPAAGGLGYYTLDDLQVLIDQHIYCFHGSEDDVVKLSWKTTTTKIYNRLISYGSERITYNLIQGADHSIDYMVFKDETFEDSLYEWLGSKVLDDNSVEKYPRYRLYNPNDGHHHWTTNQAEYEFLGTIGWNQENYDHRVLLEEAEIESVSSTNYFRLYNPNSGEHHWTTSQAEYDYLGSIGWNQEGTDGFIYPSQVTESISLYRVYNPNSGLHHYTSSQLENDTLVNLGWLSEGISGFVFPTE